MEEMWKAEIVDERTGISLSIIDSKQRKISRHYEFVPKEINKRQKKNRFTMSSFTSTQYLQ